MCSGMQTFQHWRTTGTESTTPVQLLNMGVDRSSWNFVAAIGMENTQVELGKRNSGSNYEIICCNLLYLAVDMNKILSVVHATINHHFSILLYQILPFLCISVLILTCVMSCFHSIVAVCEKLLHPWICGPVCSAPCR